MTEIATKRLYIRNLEIDDADFILKLLNSPSWLQYIGDRHVSSRADAVHYITQSPTSSYGRTRFGLKAVLLKATQTAIGLCGLIQRDYLRHPDLGFAFLPTYSRQGYGYESSSATIHQTGAPRPLYAITSTDNTASRALLNKLGFHPDGTMKMPDQKDYLKYLLS